MKKSITYILSWIGLVGIISSQAIIIFNQADISLWPSFVLLMAVLPIKGFLQNRRYTFQWTGFLSLFFLSVGISAFFEAAIIYSTSFLLLCSSVALYFGVVFHAKKLAYFEALEKISKH